jgi:hypothetical protein
MEVFTLVGLENELTMKISSKVIDFYSTSLKEKIEILLNCIERKFSKFK